LYNADFNYGEFATIRNQGGVRPPLTPPPAGGEDANALATAAAGAVGRPSPQGLRYIHKFLGSVAQAFTPGVIKN